MLDLSETRDPRAGSAGVRKEVRILLGAQGEPRREESAPEEERIQNREDNGQRPEQDC